MKFPAYDPWASDYYLTEYTPPQKTYDISQVGLKMNEIEPQLEVLLKQYDETPKFIEEIRKLLIECIKEDDLPKALAIIEWVVGMTDNLLGDDLAIIHEKDGMPSIEDIAYAMNNGDFGFHLGGYCEDLGLVDSDSK
ncbi:MAG: hypothetical protein K0Q51_9 [Rickettsiaceae bacterium]|jgi:hypothetical protein|nr:hypothetical protein [Rickettsiaceae bacterium]